MRKLATTKTIHLLAVVLSIVISRLVLWWVWDAAWMTGTINDHWHHGYTGGIVLIAAWLFLKKNTYLKAVTTGVALGLVIDEFTFPLCWFGYPVDYWSILSWGTAVVLTVGYVFVRQRRNLNL